MPVIKKNKVRSQKSNAKRVRKKSHARVGSLVSGYTQKTRSGIRIRVRGHLKSGTRVKASYAKRK